MQRCGEKNPTFHWPLIIPYGFCDNNGKLKNHADQMHIICDFINTYPSPSLNITENSAMPTPSPDIVTISAHCLRRLK